MKAIMCKLVRIGSKAPAVVLVIAAFALGYFLSAGAPENKAPQVAETQSVEPHHHGDESGAPQSEQPTKGEEWTCSMHPQIRQPKPGKCPICGMDLIPVKSSVVDDDAGPRQLKLSAKANKLAEIQVAPVERKSTAIESRMVGKIDYDETRVKHITAWVGGRIDHLYINYTGVSVTRGDPMVNIYSPDLLAAQEELIQSINAVKNLEKSKVSLVKETAQQTVDAAREKLRLLGLTKEQISEIEKRGESSDHITIYAPMSGIVVEKSVNEGMYVQTGTSIYTIVDLSSVWAKMDAYESDLEWIKNGQEVKFETEAYPGKTFTGKVVFIDPVINANTRTAKVRVNVPNPDGELKPEMFVRAVVSANASRMGTDGSDPPLVIPASAPLITGKRAVVYVAIPGKDGTYEGREITLGPRTGDYYIVRDGLKEGELVVVNGNFKIDSAIQILAKPSMMNPEGGGPVPGHHHGDAQASPSPKVEGTEAESSEIPSAFKSQIGNVFAVYFKVQQALSGDDFAVSNQEAKNLLKALEAVDMGLLSGSAMAAWMEQEESLRKSAEEVANAENIAGARAAFASLSQPLTAVAKVFGAGGAQSVIRFHCTMAFDGRGADWLQTAPEAKNPYLGKAMPTCGEQVETIPPVLKKE